MGLFAYIKNGVKYKTNQFPGAYPASRVSYNGSDVETALDELNADIITVETAVNNLDKFTLIDFVIGPNTGTSVDSQTTDLSQFKRIAIGYTYGESSYISYMEMPMDLFDNGATMTVYHPQDGNAYMQIVWSSNTKVKMNYDVKANYRGVVIGIK